MLEERIMSAGISECKKQYVTFFLKKDVAKQATRQCYSGEELRESVQALAHKLFIPDDSCHLEVFIDGKKLGSDTTLLDVQEKFGGRAVTVLAVNEPGEEEYPILVEEPDFVAEVPDRKKCVTIEDYSQGASYMLYLSAVFAYRGRDHDEDDL